MPKTNYRKSIKPLRFEESGLSKRSWNILKRLSTPAKIQDYLNKLPFNFEEDGETYMSVERALRSGAIHCFEGALVAAAALWVHGKRPLILDLKTSKKDIDHVVALFNIDGSLGAISKTNHSVLRYREPVYKDERELAMSYFHEYFLATGLKTLRSYSKPFDLTKLGTYWLYEPEDLIDIVNRLDRSAHKQILNDKQLRGLRKADRLEIRASLLEDKKGIR